MNSDRTAPLAVEEAVAKALLYAFQLSGKDYRAFQTARSEVAFIRALGQDGYVVAAAHPPATVPDEGLRDLAVRLLAEARVETGHLSVPSIIETYAERLCNAYPDDRDDILGERDDLLAWFAASQPKGPDPATKAQEPTLP